MEKHLISVIVTVYNTDKYLDRCLNSVCSQTYKNLEIIVVDDGSVDRSAAICDSYADRDRRIRVIHKENEGVVVARKVGVSNARGKYISIIDSDDYLEQNMLEELLGFLLNNECDVSMCGRFEETAEYSTPVKQGIAPGVYDRQRMMEEVYPCMISKGDFFGWGIFPSMWDKLFLRDLILEHIMNVNPALPMGNDAAVVYPCMLNAKRIVIIDDCLYHYRQNDMSISKMIRDNARIRQGFKLLYNSVSDLLSKRAYIYDCRSQWIEYVIFLMIAKFDCLYGGLETYDYLFPFLDVRRGSKVIIYGMGTYGKRLYDFIEETGICKIITSIDREYKSLKRLGIKADCIDNISDYEYDYIIIAVTYAKTRDSMLELLRGKCDLNKVRVINEKILTMREFYQFLES